MILHAAVGLLILAIVFFLVSIALAHRSEYSGINFLVWTRYALWRERFAVASFVAGIAAFFAFIAAGWAQ